MIANTNPSKQITPTAGISGGERRVDQKVSPKLVKVRASRQAKAWQRQDGAPEAGLIASAASRQPSPIVAQKASMQRLHARNPGAASPREWEARMDFGTAKMIEFFMFFGGGLAFCIHQLWSLKRDEKRRLKAEAEALARGEPPPPPPPVPGWMADRSDRLQARKAAARA
jgi:hypothetical protein